MSSWGAGKVSTRRCGLSAFLQAAASSERRRRRRHVWDPRLLHPARGCMHHQQHHHTQRPEAAGLVQVWGQVSEADTRGVLTS